MSARTQIERAFNSPAWPIAMWFAAGAFVYYLIAVNPSFGVRRELSSIAWVHSAFIYYGAAGFGQVVILTAAIFVWRGRSDLAPAAALPSIVGATLFTTAAAGFFMFARMGTPRLAVACLPFLVVGLAWSIGGVRAARALVFPAGLLLFLVPIPWFWRFADHITVLTGKWSAGIANWFGAEATFLGGAVVSTPIDLWAFHLDACGRAPYHSIYFLFVVIVVGQLTLDRSWKKLVLAACAIPLFFLASALRLASMFIVAKHVDADAATSLVHNEAYSFAFVLFTVACVATAVLVLRRIGRDSRS